MQVEEISLPSLQEFLLLPSNVLNSHTGLVERMLLRTRRKIISTFKQLSGLIRD